MGQSEDETGRSGCVIHFHNHLIEGQKIHDQADTLSRLWGRRQAMHACRRDSRGVKVLYGKSGDSLK
jgi:hypothetical protein